MVECKIGAVASMSDTRRVPRGRAVTPAARERITVDLRGLKPALTEQARARGVPPSQFVRDVLESALGQANAAKATACDTRHTDPGERVRLSLRLHRVITIDAPMSERVRPWREDYPHFVEDPMEMVRKLEPLKPQVGKETLEYWRTLAGEGRVDELFESIMVRHHDPFYERSTRKHYGDALDGERLELTSLGGEALTAAVTSLVARVAAE